MRYMSRDAVTPTAAALAAEPQRTRRSRLGAVAVVALAVPLALTALGCRAAITPPPDATGSADLASIEASPTPGSAEILKLSGKGNKESDEFHATGLSVDVKFDYKCSPENSFTLNFYGAGVSPELPDVLVDEFGATRSDTVNEALNNNTGPFHLEIQTGSECEWSVSVLGSK